MWLAPLSGNFIVCIAVQWFTVQLPTKNRHCPGYVTWPATHSNDSMSVNSVGCFVIKQPALIAIPASVKKDAANLVAPYIANLCNFFDALVDFRRVSRGIFSHQ
jgi:hypothetical protein